MSTTIVYRCPGRHLITNGVTFDTLGIEIADLDKALSDGWHETVPAAIEAFAQPAQAPVATPEPTPVPAADDNAPPTRAEMLQQAEILGIKIDKRWSDDTLLSKIQAAMTPPASPAPAEPGADPADADDPI